MVLNENILQNIVTIMKRKIIGLSLCLSAIVLMFPVACKNSDTHSDEAVKVIFDTDMGNDIDDALALDMLYKYMDEGKVELLGITSNKEEPQSVEFIDIMNTFYGYPDIPIGKITDGADCDRVNSYTSQIASDISYHRSVADYGGLPESVELMRQLLSQEKDGDVIIIAVGFSTNLQRLMASGPDKYSDLDGMDLIRTKVRHLYMMAGEFEDENGKSAEYNIRIDRDAAADVFDSWPTPVTTSPFEVGSKMLYPVSSILNDFDYAGKHPLAEAYKVYKPMPYDRQMWDPSAVLYAIEHDKGYFTTGGKGKITVDGNSMTWFERTETGKHEYLKLNDSAAPAALTRMMEVITSVPASSRQ